MLLRINDTIIGSTNINMNGIIYLLHVKIDKEIHISGRMSPKTVVQVRVVYGNLYHVVNVKLG